MRVTHPSRLLTIFYLATSIQTTITTKIYADEPNRDTMRALAPAICLANGIDCSCYGPKALGALSKSLEETQLLKYQLNAYKELEQKIEEKPWYANPSVVIGGVAIGVGIGGVLGYLLKH